MLSIGQVIKNTNKSLKNKYGKAILCTIIYEIVVYGLYFISNLITGNVQSLNQNIDMKRNITGIVFSLCSYIIIIPFMYSYFFNLMDLYREREFSFSNLYRYTINNFKKAWCLLGRKLQKLLLPILLLLVPYIFMFFSFAIVIFTANGTTFNEIANTTLIACTVVMIIALVLMVLAVILLYVKELLYFPIYYIAYDNPEMTGLEIVNESERIMKGNRLNYFALALIFMMAIVVSVISTLGIGLIFVLPYIYFANMVFYDGLTGKISEN